MSEVRQVLRFVLDHPLNRGHGARALCRLARWQILSRLSRTGRRVPFVDDTTLWVRKGMTGATGNVYCGLHEYEHMAFLLHFLRAGDLFVDIGANVGSCTVLAAGAVHANVIAIEPVEAARSGLLRNVALNGVENLVEIHGVGLADAPGELQFLVTDDTTNRVVAEAGDRTVLTIHVDTLDRILGRRSAALIKIDVEGYEAKVLAGAGAALTDGRAQALIVELNGSGRAYGVCDDEVDRGLLEQGYQRVNRARFPGHARGRNHAAIGIAAAWCS